MTTHQVHLLTGLIALANILLTGLMALCAAFPRTWIECAAWPLLAGWNASAALDSRRELEDLCLSLVSNANLDLLVTVECEQTPRTSTAAIGELVERLTVAVATAAQIPPAFLRAPERL